MLIFFCLWRFFSVWLPRTVWTIHRYLLPIMIADEFKDEFKDSSLPSISIIIIILCLLHLPVSLLLPLLRRLCFCFGFSVCLFVSRITQKVIHGFLLNFWGVSLGTGNSWLESGKKLFRTGRGLHSWSAFLLSLTFLYSLFNFFSLSLHCSPVLCTHFCHPWQYSTVHLLVMHASL